MTADDQRPPSKQCPDCKGYVPDLPRHRRAEHSPEGWEVTARLAQLEEQAYQQVAYITVLEETVRNLSKERGEENIDFIMSSLKGISQLESGYYWEDEELNRMLSEVAND